MHLIVRTAGDPNALAPEVRRAVWSVDKDQPINGVASMTRVIDETHGGNGLFSAIMATFAALALLLAAVGLYGVIAYSVSQRTHEIGIRMALGAPRGEIAKSVISRGMLLAAVGAAIGLAAATPLPRLLEAMFEGFTVHSSVIFISVPFLLLIVVLVAIYIPASRAAKVDPMVALRHE
jgi:putative ABC transport system permease protein